MRISCELRTTLTFACWRWWQVPGGLSASLARTFHIVEACTRMQLASMGKVAHSVPFCYKGFIKMTLYKGNEALETRRAVASKLTPSLIAALQRPRHLDDKADFAPMQQLYDAGLSYDPISGMPVFDPSCMKPRRGNVRLVKRSRAGGKS